MLIPQYQVLALKLSSIYTVSLNMLFSIPQNQRYPGTPCINGMKNIQLENKLLLFNFSSSRLDHFEKKIYPECNGAMRCFFYFQDKSNCRVVTTFPPPPSPPTVLGNSNFLWVVENETNFDHFSNKGTRRTCWCSAAFTNAR